jgi:hypothetical protein
LSQIISFITMDPNNIPSNNNTSGGANNETSKRQAMTGQWRTPPLPVFASGTQPAGAPQPMQAVAQPTIQLPESTDDYTKALQEAYRRGAEAAAAMQQQIPNAVSCPNFHQLPPVAAPAAPVPDTPPQQPAVLLVPNPLAAGGTADARSFSLPDMASYAARAQAEEEKRKKRLARNRASARLRRLRKKNLVRSCDFLLSNVCFIACDSHLTPLILLL